MTSTTIETNSTAKNAVAYFGWAMVSVPVTIILHELGHFVAGYLFQFPNLTLHYGSVSHNAAEQSFPVWQQAVQAAAGPLVTVFIALFCCYYGARKQANAFIISAGMVAPIRFLVGAVFLFWAIAILVMGGKLDAPNFDEYNIAKFSSIPLIALLGIETLIMLYTWWFLGRQIPQKGRLLSLVSIIAGIVVGALLWLNFIGPQLLP